MITRRKVLSLAVDACMRELYSLVQPSVEWDEFLKENKIYSEKFEIWEKYNRAKNRKEENPKEWEKENSLHPEWNDKNITECIGPRPYEFYYLPKEVFKEVVDSYIFAYEIDHQQNLLDIIEILKGYCNEPIVDKYIEGELCEDGTRWPGHRGYDRPDNIYKEIAKIVSNYSLEPAKEDSDEVVDLCNKFFEFLDMAGNFYSWHGELHAFNTAVYLGASPSSNKESVIDNWKIYRKQKIEIDDDKYNEEQDYD